MPDVERPASRTPMTMHWAWARLADLGPDDLYDALALRARVFVVEQACAFQDPDDVDRHCWHLLGRDATGVLVAYLRVVDPPPSGGGPRDRRAGPTADPGTDPLAAAPAIGRVVTAPEVRGTGAGRTLFAEGLARCLAAWPRRGVWLNAQSRLEPFYAAFGFRRAGEDFLEDGIPHVPMWRAP